MLFLSVLFIDHKKGEDCRIMGINSDYVTSIISIPIWRCSRHSSRKSSADKQKSSRKSSKSSSRKVNESLGEYFC